MNEKIYVAPEAAVVEFEEKDLLLLSVGGEGTGNTKPFAGDNTKEW